MTDFDDFMTQREAASTAFVEGDVRPLLALSVVDGPASIFPPTGAVVEGAEAVNTGNERSVAMFAPGAENAFEVLHAGSDGDLGYWTGVQRSRLNLRGQDEPVVMDLRVTELFRRVDGKWRLFHRHADRLPQG